VQILIVAREASEHGRRLGARIEEFGGAPAYASSAGAAVAAMERLQPELVAVEVGSAFSEGLEAVRRIRVLSPVPLIALGTAAEQKAIIRALEIGADHYLTTLPESVDLLRASLASLLRRVGRPPVESGILRFRDLAIDFDRCEGFIGEHPLRLTPSELRLLATLIRNAGRVVSAQQLVSDAQGYRLSENDAREIAKAHLHRLRAKMEPHEHGTPHIVNVRGFGYMLERRSAPRMDDFLPAFVGENGEGAAV
jgi:two-component system KDP operon response regulator KdpE